MRLWKGALGLVMFVPLCAAVGAVAGGCSGGPNDQAGGSAGSSASAGNAGNGGNSGNAGAAMAGSGGVGGFVQGGAAGSGMNPDAACVATSAEATLEKKPVDIIFIIDNSGSMTDNIESVQNNINANFAAIIGASGIDYRVIMIAEHGELSSQSVCVSAPLSTTSCMPVPEQPGQNDPIFFQYSVTIGSHNSWCRALDSYKGNLQDDFGLAPGGWSQWLRKEAVKVFVEVTDDNVSCSLDGTTYQDGNTEAGGMTSSAAFDAALLALDPEQFGDAMKRNYIWHSIIGLTENDPATKEYVPGDPVVTGHCSSAVNPGTGYQVLSQLTGGLRFPICQFASFDVVFQAIAKGVIAGAKVACEFQVPEPPAGETIDLTTVVLEYTAGGMGDPQKLKQVMAAKDCNASSFYIENNIIKLCPVACATVQGDDKAKINILFGCKQDIN
jgi:hypothetical protein